MAKAVAFNELLVASKLSALPEDQYSVRARARQRKLPHQRTSPLPQAHAEHTSAHRAAARTTHNSPQQAHNSSLPRDPVKRKASKQAYEQSDKGKARKQAYDQSDKGQANKQRYKQSDKGQATAQAYDQSDQGKARKQAYDQSDKGQATAQAAKQRAASAAAERAASAASASLAFLTELKGQPHAQRVSDYFSEEELAAAADKVPHCPSYFRAARTSPGAPRAAASSA